MSKKETPPDVTPASRSEGDAASSHVGPMSNIFLLGASGRTGRIILDEALRQGHKVTAFVRNPARITVQHEHLRVVGGSVYDFASLEKAYAGEDVFVSALTSDEKPHDTCSASTKNVLNLMEAKGVRFYSVIGGAGTDAEVRARQSWFESALTSTILLLFKASAADRVLEYKMLTDAQAAHPDWHLRSLSPPFLTNGPRTGKYANDPTKPGIKLWSTISRADLADFMLKVMNKPRTEPRVAEYIYYP
eukprot:Opistho-2@35909